MFFSNKLKISPLGGGILRAANIVQIWACAESYDTMGRLFTVYGGRGKMGQTVRRGSRKASDLYAPIWPFLKQQELCSCGQYTMVKVVMI